MEAAKASVKKVLSKGGQHDTTVHESVAPAVQNETVTRTEHEKIIPAVDREVHQHHHHTTEQPIEHSAVLPETHHHQEMPMKTQTFDHNKGEDLQRSLDTEKAKYQDTQVLREGEKTNSTEGVVAGEHVHHHVHETIQPVVQKQTVEPHVVHTTVPVHEIHNKEPLHHSSHALPAMSMDDFKKQGGSLQGREERSDFFHGEPKGFPGSGSGSGTALGMDGQGQKMSSTSGTNTGDLTSSHNTSTSNSGNFGTMEEKKPSLMDRLNPKKDADGDGKSGVMS